MTDTSPPPFVFYPGTAPLLVSMPHAGTYVPPALAARFTGRGPWKKRLPQILETLAVLGRASRDGAGAWRGGA